MSAGYGVETWCTDSLVTGRLVRGPMVVVQALYRRFITPRGTLSDGDEGSAYGLDLSGLVGHAGTEAAIRQLPAAVRAEALKDDRVLTCEVTASITTAENGEVSIEIEISGTLVNEGEAFALTLGITDAATTLIKAAA